jgi:hypothetical protein
MTAKGGAWCTDWYSIELKICPRWSRRVVFVFAIFGDLANETDVRSIPLRVAGTSVGKSRSDTENTHIGQSHSNCSAARTNVVFTNSYVDNNSCLISE